MIKIFLSVFILFFTCILQAQVVNMEPARMQTDTTGWAGSASAGFSLTKNTQQIFAVNIDAHLQHKTVKDLWLLLCDYSLLKANSQKVISNNFFHLRYNYKIRRWLTWEAFAQLQSNAVTQIDSRFLTGTGPRFKIIGTHKIKLYAATLAMYENEKESTEPVIIHNDIRSSSYISLSFFPTEMIQLVSTFFYQPLYKSLNDYRFFNQTSLTVKAGKHFGMYLKWNFLHDRFPAGIAPKTTYDMGSGVQFSL